MGMAPENEKKAWSVSPTPFICNSDKWAHLGSNQGPTGYEPVALPAELWAQIFLFLTFGTLFVKLYIDGFVKSLFVLACFIPVTYQ
jgi:hypothetical protein